MLMRAEKLSSAGGHCTTQLTEKAIAGFATAASLLTVGPSALDPDTRNVEQGTTGLCSPPRDGLNVDSEKAMKPKPKKRAPAGGKGAIAPKKSKAPSKLTDKLTDAAGRLKTGGIDKGSTLSVTEKKPRKPRVKKDKVEEQPKIIKGKITKPGTKAGKKEGSIKRKRSTVVTETVIAADSTGSPDVVELPTVEQELGLDKAVTRRKCWTPPKETGQLVDGACEKTRSTVQSVGLAPIPALGPSSKSFGSLFSSFGFAQEPERRMVPQIARDCDGIVLTKRRKIEASSIAYQTKTTLLLTVGYQLQDVAVQGRTTTPVSKRSKSPKKKPVTITEKATAQYMVKDPNPTAPLLQYFGPQDSSGTGGRPVTDGNDDGKPKKPTKPAKATTAKRKPKNGTAALPLLLSPQSALKKVNNQDILFGTSSQLAEEGSPTFLRELQQALKVSEVSSNRDSFVDSAYGGEMPTKPKAIEGLKGARVSSRRLWASAARDSEGNLMDAEIVNLVDSPPASTDSISVKATGEAITEDPALPIESAEDDAWMVLDDKITAEVLKDRPREQSKEQEPTQSNDKHVMTTFSEEVSLEKRSRSKSPVRKTKKSKSKTIMVQSSQTIQKPDYVGYQTARLATELASYGFKPIKNRDQMIALLEKCWEGKNRVALQSLTTNANPLNSGPPNTKGVAEAEKGVEKLQAKAQSRSKSGKPSSTESLRPADPAPEAELVPKKPRGRPRKTTTTVPSTGATQQPKETRTKPAPPSPKTKKPNTAKRKTTPSITVEEISDSDTPLTPSPPRRRSSRSSPTTPRPLDLRPATATAQTTTPDLSPAAAQTQLFTNITKAITTFPRSTNSKYPTWHEKILMYDPIVLEDLAYWLNTEGLGRVGVDVEVGPGVVKAWCEARSVCCLWRENLRGGGRARR